MCGAKWTEKGEKTLRRSECGTDVGKQKTPLTVKDDLAIGGHLTDSVEARTASYIKCCSLVTGILYFLLKGRGRIHIFLMS